MIFLNVLLYVIVASTVFYVLLSVTILVLCGWLKNKMRDNPTGSIENYQNCSWYIAPKTTADFRARTLVKRGFVQYFGDFGMTSILILVVAVAVILFLNYVIKGI